MKSKVADVNGRSKQDSKYLILIDDYLSRIKELRADMRRSRKEIQRLKATSRQKLAEIDSILKAC